MKEIVLTDHARLKLAVLARHGVHISEEAIRQTLLKPDRTDTGYSDRKVAQAAFNGAHVLRVVYEETEQALIVITLYPGRKDRYA